MRMIDVVTDRDRERDRERERDENDRCDIDYRRYDKTYPRIAVHSDSCNADRSIALCYNLSYLKSSLIILNLVLQKKLKKNLTAQKSTLKISLKRNLKIQPKVETSNLTRSTQHTF